METHFAVALAGAEIGIGSGLEHFLEAGEVVEIELAKETVAEPGRLQLGGGEDGVEDGVMGVFAGVIEGFVVVRFGTRMEEEFGHAVERVFGGDGGLCGEQDQALGGGCWIGHGGRDEG